MTARGAPLGRPSASSWGKNISPSGAFDQGKTMDQVLAIVKQTGFVKG